MVVIPTPFPKERPSEPTSDAGTGPSRAGRVS